MFLKLAGGTLRVEPVSTAMTLTAPPPPPLLLIAVTTSFTHAHCTPGTVHSGFTRMVFLMPTTTVLQMRKLNPGERENLSHVTQSSKQCLEDLGPGSLTLEFFAFSPVAVVCQVITDKYKKRLKKLVKTGG